MASISYPSGACVRYSYPKGWVAFLSTPTTKTVRTIEQNELTIISSRQPRANEQAIFYLFGVTHLKIPWVYPSGKPYQ